MTKLEIKSTSKTSLIEGEKGYFPSVNILEVQCRLIGYCCVRRICLFILSEINLSFPSALALCLLFCLVFFYSMKEIKHFFCVCTGLSKLNFHELWTIREQICSLRGSWVTITRFLKFWRMCLCWSLFNSFTQFLSFVITKVWNHLCSPSFISFTQGMWCEYCEIWRRYQSLKNEFKPANNFFLQACHMSGQGQGLTWHAARLVGHNVCLS